ncbi:MAG TPA: glycosyltransferase family 4 protein [Solirubrobacteraceae bacterium]|nr:glycosyltransferase family 4 protein [Solirubrobacteraceae bacterium]
MPRLLLITPDYPPAHGGIQLFAHRLAVGIERFQTRVVALDCEGARRFDARGTLTVRRAPSDPRLGPARQLALNAVALGEAARFRPHVTLSMHLVASPAAAAIRRLHGAPTVQYFHAREIDDKPRLAAFAARAADVVIAVSSCTARLVAAAGASPGATRTIPPGVDLPADPSPLPAERPTLLTVARLEHRYKGHDVLVRALALVREHVPDVQWVVIGEGPLRGELEELARAHGVGENVRFLGSLEDEQRDAWLRRADVFAMPSRVPDGGTAGEGFGIVYMEAAAHAKPVVAGNVAGALDAVLDGETGLLVDPTDPAAVAAAITRLLRDERLARRMGEAGAVRARGYAWATIAARVEAVLLEQLERAPA